MKNLFMLTATISLAGTLTAVNCERTVKVNSAKEMKIEVVINKDQYRGFARLAEFLPEGSVVKYAKSEGGTFIIQNNELKFIWLALPQQNTVVATYIISMETLKEGNYDINGKFSYVDGGETKEYEIPTSTFTINNNQVASIGSTLMDIKTVNNTSVGATSAEKAKIENTKIAKVTYALQLLSTKDKLPSNYFAEKYQINDKVKVESQNSLNKYMLGEFKSIEEAKAYRESTLMKKGFKDAFIVAYSNNQRITMDEAKKMQGEK